MHDTASVLLPEMRYATHEKGVAVKKTLCMFFCCDNASIAIVTHRLEAVAILLAVTLGPAVVPIQNGLVKGSLMKSQTSQTPVEHTASRAPFHAMEADEPTFYLKRGGKISVKALDDFPQGKTYVYCALFHTICCLMLFCSQSRGCPLHLRAVPSSDREPCSVRTSNERNNRKKAGTAEDTVAREGGRERTAEKAPRQKLCLWAPSQFASSCR